MKVYDFLIEKYKIFYQFLKKLQGYVCKKYEDFMSAKEDGSEHEYLPAALEIVEKPTSPNGRYIIWGIFSLIMVALLISWVGKIDEVSVATGKIIPDGQIKIIQPVESGKITAIHIVEGQHVKKDEVLLELDSSVSEAEVEALNKTLDTAKLERDLLKSIFNGEELKEYEGILSENNVVELIQLSLAKENEYQAKKIDYQLLLEQAKLDLDLERNMLDSLNQRLNLYRADASRSGQYAAGGGNQGITLEKLKDNLKALKEREKSYTLLYEAGAIAKEELININMQVLNLESDIRAGERTTFQETLTIQKDLDESVNMVKLTEIEIRSQRNKILLAETALKKAQQDILKNDLTYEISNRSTIVEKEKEIAALESQLEQAKSSLMNTKLCAPVDGIILSFEQNTVGSVLTPAQTVATIVPDGTPLIIEAFVQNKDIGFIRKGQNVRIKVDTFQFQKYGTINGVVAHVSSDAFQDERLGLVYKVKIKPDKLHFNVEGAIVNISPGMTVSAEVITGKRRVIEFFLEPLVKYLDEGLKVR